MSSTLKSEGCDYNKVDEWTNIIYTVHENNFAEFYINNNQINIINDSDMDTMPMIAYLGFSIHGDEASGTEASLLLLHHLAAGSGQEINNILKNTVLIVDPMFNPDGRDRFVNWVNGNRGKVPSSDPQDREHNQPWPRGRTNHYLFDMNRDWMPVTQPESNGRIKLFHHWRPQFLLDAHEMGASSTFFFQPGIPSRNNPNTPQGTIDLANKLAPYHAKRLDDIQSMYYSQQSYDDFYLVKVQLLVIFMVQLGYYLNRPLLELSKQIQIRDA